MDYTTKKYVGFDVSKDSIAVSVAEEGREAARYVGLIPHKQEAIRKVLKKIGEPGQLLVCYEAGPTGYVLYRWLRVMGIACKVIAPSLIPIRAGDRIKTDRRDSLRLAHLLRAGELVEIHVPEEKEERLRDLSRLREDARADLHRDRQRLLKWLLRRQIHHPEHIKTRWTKAFDEWLDALELEDACDRLIVQEYRQAIRETESRLDRLEKIIQQTVKRSPQEAIVHVLQAFRGISALAAFTIAQEVVDFGRFPTAGHAMGYTGLVPRESSSGVSTWRGGITKTGNTHLRRMLIEAAWSYRHKPVVKGELKKRLEALPPEFATLSWNAQTRLHQKYYELVIQKGKHPNVATAAIARELVGFLWAAARLATKQAS